MHPQHKATSFRYGMRMKTDEYNLRQQLRCAPSFPHQLSKDLVSRDRTTSTCSRAAFVGVFKTVGMRMHKQWNHTVLGALDIWHAWKLVVLGHGILKSGCLDKPVIGKGGLLGAW